MVAVKKCSKCRQQLEAAEFSPQHHTKSGLSSWCKRCKREKQEERNRAKGHKARPKRTQSAPGLRECLQCRTLLSCDQFSPSSRGVDGLSAYCRPCATARLRASQGKQSEYVRRWREGNNRYLMNHRAQQGKRRATLAGVDTGLVTVEVLQQVYAVERCHYCEERTNAAERTVDHVIPISRGGLHHPDNLVMACVKCNSSKQALTGKEFLERLNRCQPRPQLVVG